MVLRAWVARRAGTRRSRSRTVGMRERAIPAAQPVVREMLNASTAQASQAALAVNFPDGRWIWAKGPFLSSAMVCSGDRVPAVTLVCGYGVQRGVGDEGVVPVGGEQLVLTGLSSGVEAADPAHHQSAGHALVLGAGSERGEFGLGDFGVGYPPADLLIEDGVRVLDRLPRGVVDAGDRAGHGRPRRDRQREPATSSGDRPHGQRSCRTLSRPG